MKAIRVRVENGRITSDAPPETSDGELELRVAEPEDDMSDDELAKLNEALTQGFEQICYRRAVAGPSASVSEGEDNDLVADDLVRHHEREPIEHGHATIGAVLPLRSSFREPEDQLDRRVDLSFEPSPRPGWRAS